MAFFRRAWFQIHWFIGITAGTVLVLIGLSGATLSFRAEIVDLLNPQLNLQAPPGTQRLSPAALLERVQAGGHPQKVAAVTVFADASRPARINFAPPPGQRRGEAHLADPYTGQLLPEPRGEAFFEFVEQFHRWLLLPRDTGKSITGVLAICMLVLALSGLYLRWPRRPLAWRAWLKLDFALTGRAFLWNLHAVVGTVALLAYVMSASTGIYWGFDAVSSWVDEVAGQGRRPPPQRAPTAPASEAGKLDLDRTWQSFNEATQGDWSQVTLRLPSRAGAPVEATYLRAVPEHERARNRIDLQASTGIVTRHERYADKPMGGRLVASVYPLHMGTYWGLPGRIVMTLASLGLSLFAITGWMLYLGRRRTKRAVRAERERLGLPASSRSARGGPAAGIEQVLVAFATQTGQAERVALQTASALQSAGVAAIVKPLAELSADALLHFRKVLWVVSTFGDGDPPDSARAFAREFARQSGSHLRHVQYGMLALGDWHYATFCGFGRKLDHDLRNQGAQAMFPMVEIGGGDADAMGRWQQRLAKVFGIGSEAWPTQAHEADPVRTWTADAFETWHLANRRLLNEGSQGDPLFEITLTHDEARAWAPGALIELVPERTDGARSADALAPLSPRSYSIASIPSDGSVQLLVRQARHDNGLGVASGWLTVGAALGAPMRLRIVDNPAFALIDDDAPCLFIGNGSGFAGLRAHLRERARRGHGRNWLVYGERHSSHDGFNLQEIEDWRARALLARVDLVYSREQVERRYVQDLLREAAEEVGRWVDDGAVVYVCGSLEGMAPGVDAALQAALGADAFDDLIATGRYRRDVY